MTASPTGLHGLLINPFDRTVTRVELTVPHDYRQIYSLIDADCFDAIRLDDNDAIFVDDEGLLKPVEDMAYFTLRGHHGTPYAGKGLLLGADDEGETVSPQLTVEQLAHMVVWLDPPSQDAIDILATPVVLTGSEAINAMLKGGAE